MTQPYSVQKLVHHPEVLQALRERRHQPPTQIHFMPALACNQHCQFCSYGHRTKDDEPDQFHWKNMALMSDAFMPLAKMRECVADWQAMGVKAVELTGGGEPLIYPYVDTFLHLMAGWGADLGLVTNGTALTAERADLFAATRWKWARVSVDAGTPGTYVITRRVPRSHWRLAWRAVELLANRKNHPEQRVGVGYVVDRTNFDGVYDACRLAVENGADNVRIALAFTPSHLQRFPEGAVEEAADQAKQVAADFGGLLQVNDFVNERAGNIQAGAQDYQFCAAKEVLCVVGGDQQVYNCCTLAFTKKGLVGSIVDKTFRQLWEESAPAFYEHDARKICNVPCLYEQRNRAALNLLGLSTEEVSQLASRDAAIHRNFI